MIMISGPIDEIGIYDERFALFSKELDSKVEPSSMKNTMIGDGLK